MGIGKYLWVCPKFSAIILETIRARKLKLKTQLDVVKYSLWLHSVNLGPHDIWKLLCYS